MTSGWRLRCSRPSPPLVKLVPVDAPWPMALVYWQPGTPSAVAPDTVAVVPTKMPQVDEPLL